ncbi:MAG TPA: hypothetical protein VGG48_13725 [Rhizomicrobium sp.]
MKKKGTELTPHARALKFLQAQRHALIETGADDDVIAALTAILQHVASLSPEEIRRKASRAPIATSYSSALAKLPLRDASQMSVAEIEGILANPDTPRKILEAIAVAKFHFPRGSLRSLSNLEMLRSKIRSLLDNQRAHATIHFVAAKSKRT